MDLDPRRLLLLREVARQGSLAGAARALGLTQPAVSQSLRVLETAVALPLIVRQGRGVVLTDAGRALLAHAEAVADSLEAARQELSALAGLSGGQVRLAAFPTAAAVLLPAALTTLREKAPGLQVRFTELEPPEAEHVVRSGEVDLAVVFRHDRDDDPVPGDLLRLPLARDAVLLVTPDGFAGPPRLGELRDQPWIAGCARCRAHLLRCAAACGFLPDVRYETEDFVVVQRLVARGLGVALLPAWALAVSPTPGVQALALSELDDRIVEVLLRPEARRIPAVGAALAALADAVP